MHLDLHDPLCHREQKLNIGRNSWWPSSLILRNAKGSTCSIQANFLYDMWKLIGSGQLYRFGMKGHLHTINYDSANYNYINYTFWIRQKNKYDFTEMYVRWFHIYVIIFEIDLNKYLLTYTRFNTFQFWTGFNFGVNELIKN